MEKQYIFYKHDKNSRVWNVRVCDEKGVPLLGPVCFSFDKKKVYNYWTDYPDKFTEEEIKIFQEDVPEWAYDDDE